MLKYISQWSPNKTTLFANISISLYFAFSAVFNFNLNELKLDKTNLKSKHLKTIAFLLAHDLKSFAKTDGNFSNLLANEVYTHLQNN